VSASIKFTGKLRPDSDVSNCSITCPIKISTAEEAQDGPERGKEEKKYIRAGVVPLTKEFPYKSITVKE
jgi:hypothetical protein